MRKIVLIITVVLLSCGSERGSDNLTMQPLTERSEYKDSLFYGNKFNLSTKYDEDSCASLDFCDCCFYELIFLNRNRFVQVAPCGAIDYYTGGTYSYDGGLLELSFKNVLIPDECRSGPLSLTEEGVISEYLKRIEDTAYYSIDTCNNIVSLSSLSLKFNDRGVISNLGLAEKINYINSKILNGLDLK